MQISWEQLRPLSSQEICWKPPAGAEIRILCCTNAWQEFQNVASDWEDISLGFGDLLGVPVFFFVFFLLK